MQNFANLFRVSALFNFGWYHLKYANTTYRCIFERSYYTYSHIHVVLQNDDTKSSDMVHILCWFCGFFFHMTHVHVPIFFLIFITDWKACKQRHSFFTNDISCSFSKIMHRYLHMLHVSLNNVVHFLFVWR